MKDFTRGTAADKVLRDKAFNINKGPKYDGRGIKNENISNKQLAEELHKLIFRKFEKKRYTHLL